MANVSSNNLTTLYSGGGVNIRPTSAYGNSNVVALLNVGTDGGNTVTNIVATGNITATSVNTPTVYSQGMVTQGYDFVQMQYSNGVALPVNAYDIGTGSWFYLDAGGAVWQSNTTGTLKTVVLGNDGNVTADYFIGNVVGNISNATYANYANFAGNLINGTSNVNTNGSGGNISISVGGVSNVAVITSNSINLNYPINTPNNVFIGANAGNRTVVQVGHIAIGTNAGNGTQPTTSFPATISIGVGAGNISQGTGAIAIGNPILANPFYTTGANQAIEAIAIGTRAGVLQGFRSIALGSKAGTKQENDAIAIGNSAGGNQTAGTIAIGTYSAGDAGNLQNQGAIAIGTNAGHSNQGRFSIAIGENAGPNNQAINSIILNATGSDVDQTTANTFTVKPVRNANTANVMFYDNTTGEITYDLIGNAIVANSNYANFAGTAYSVDGANVSGEVANANYATYSGTAGTANSVAVGNVSGIGNIATINLDGNASNILYGNGVFGPDTGPQDVANANYANFAGDVVNSTQSNITSVGNLINLRVENANVHLGTNAGLGNIGTDIIAIGNNSAASNIVISTNFISWDGGGFVLEVTDTTGIDRGYTVSGTGFTLGQTVNSVIDSGNLQMNDDADGTPSGVMTFSSAQGNTSVAIGNNAGYTTQNAGSVAIGNSAGYTGQFPQSVAVGDRAGETNQGGGSLALGAQAGKDTQGDQSTAIGSLAGSNNQGSFAVAIGVQSGQTTQGQRSVAIGIQAGQTTQGGFSVSIGDRSATTGQGANSVAIGSRAGNSSQGINSVAIGANAAFASQGANSIAIGKNAGKTSQANNSIILNATGANLNQTTANTFTVKPVRNIIQTNAVFYNTSTGEISYDTLANNTSNIGANIITANNVSISNSGFMKLASYTATALNAITGQIGWMAAVSDSSGGSNPNGMIAFWDTTNSRWSYVHDNSAV